MAVSTPFAEFLSAPLIWAVVIVLSLATIAIRKYMAYKRLAHFKGPFWASWTELWLAKETFTGQIHTTGRDVIEEYGPFVRIGPNLLLTNDVDLTRKMGMARSKYAKAEWYDGLRLDPRINSVISETDQKKHSELRSKLSGGYSGRDTPGRDQSVDDRTVDLVNLIERKYLSAPSDLKVLDLALITQFYTLDILTDVAFGHPFGFLAADDDLYDYIKSFAPLLPYMELNQNITWIASFMNSKLMRRLFMPTANDGSGMGKMIGVAQETVAKRFQPNAKQHPDMLGSFMKNGLTQLEAEGESLLQVVAGADSSATAIRITMYLLLTSPLVFVKLRAEIDEADRAHRISWPVITDAEARSLPYLQAVIKEGLRAWPPAVGISTKWVPPEGEMLEDGRFIPGGTRIGTAVWGTQHDKGVFGDDARYFRPERWLEVEPGSEKLLRMERTTELIFGNGRYGCLGKALSFVELNKVITTFIRYFDMSVLDPTTPFKSQANGLFIQSKLLIRVAKRNRIV